MSLRRMRTNFVRRRRWYRPLLICALAAATIAILFSRPRAQSNRIVLISQETSTRAIAIDSVMQTREPFATTTAVSWHNDNRTRVMLFVTGLNLQPDESASDVTADAEDGMHRIYSLPVEYVGPVPGQDWVRSVVVRLNEELSDLGDVLVAINYHEERSNRVRLAIGHIGGGPPDDAGAVPTPGTLAPPTPALPTAGTVTTSDVQ